MAVGLLLVALAGGTRLRAQDTAAPAVSPGATHTVYLEYREGNSSGVNWGLSLFTQAQPFQKEPGFGQRKVIRGTLKFGSDADQSLPFIWDPAQARLYLDLNRNGDLTDDPAGVFSCPDATKFGGYAQTFTNIHLAFTTPMGIHPALVDLTLQNFNNQPAAFAGWRSFWEGKVSLQGGEWQLGLIENTTSRLGSGAGGYLLLRPWAARNEAFDLQNGSLEAFNFSRGLFFQKQAYQIECAYVQQGGAPKYRIDLKEQQVELTELKLTGQFIKRLVLPGSRFTAVVDAPGAVVKVPVGSYGQCQVQLEQGGVQAYRELPGFTPSPSANALVVSATNRPTLNAGGHLTNSVGVTRRGKSLNFNYRLIGAAGETYRLQGVRRQPEFAVYQAGNKIASGKFEFG